MNEFQNQPPRYPLVRNPQGPFAPVNTFLKPVQNAAIFMTIVAVVVLLFGVCAGVFSQVDLQQIAKESGQPMPEMPPGFTWDMFRRVARIAAPILVAFGLLQLALSIFVRRCSVIACKTALFLTWIPLLYFGFSLLATMTLKNIAALLIAVIQLGLFVVQYVLLRRARERIRDLQSGSFSSMSPGMSPGMSPPFQSPMTSSMPPTAAVVPLDGIGENQNPYHAAPAGPTPQAQPQTGWLWTSPPPAPPGLTPSAPNSQGSTGGSSPDSTPPPQV